jgi:hypothetical protein
MSEIPNWIVETTNDDGKPVGWRNTETYTFIGIRYSDEIENWEVAGENSRLYTVETETEAREKAIEYMHGAPTPSPMV